ncbi:MAG: hypothetical protein WBP93_13590, partial [Pyrinomonadaceae bacterium]
MKRKTGAAMSMLAVLLIIMTIVWVNRRAEANEIPAVNINTDEATSSVEPTELVDIRDDGFDVDVLVNGYPLEEYQARGRHYVEAVEGAEYELRIHNPLGVRVAVALSVDGLNTIDARRTTAWEASKWVIGPYQTISISGWQMSSVRARRFYFTSERDSYGAKLGATANLGVISAVFFRERERYPVQIVPPRPRPIPMENEDGVSRDENKDRAGDDRAGNAPSASTESRRGKSAGVVRPEPDDESAATGIGRDVRNDVRWVNLDLDSHAISSVAIRYEYRAALVRLGILPRPYPNRDPLERRERATGFRDR